MLALVLGGLIGLERELSDHPAGLRTHIGVCMGAALFGIVSGYGFVGFDASRSQTNYQVDPTRVASNIVTGVGFLGGGAILKHGATVRGLTTAASLWVTAAIGPGLRPRRLQADARRHRPHAADPRAAAPAQPLAATGGCGPGRR